MPLRTGSLGFMLAVALAGAAAGGASQQTLSASITVFAASDLGPAFKRLAPQYEQATGNKVTVVLGSTGTLTQQIRNGAPADVFFAANDTYIQQLAAERLTIESTRSLYARGLIATVALKTSTVRVEKISDLDKPEIRRIAIANPTHAPYGLAAKQALEATGLWQKVATKLVYGENVQQAAQFVRTGSVEAAIVARSVVDTADFNWTLIDQRLHAPLDQTAVALARTKHAAAATAFIAFVNGTQGRGVMRQFGFLLPGEAF